MDWELASTLLGKLVWGHKVCVECNWELASTLLGKLDHERHPTHVRLGISFYPS